MNIIVLNGSPRGETSNTYKLTTAFLEGLSAGGENHAHTIDTVTISKASIKPCLGCFSCWTKTPGQCVISDDMTDILTKYIRADLVIWSFPLYYFSMPSPIKALMDRLLPLNLPTITDAGYHPPRYDLSRQRHVLISTCGFYSVKGNYDALLRQFEIMFPDCLTTVICPEGELLRIPYLSGRTREYLAHVRKAGTEYASQGAFTPETRAKLDELLYSPEAFMDMANASWDIAESGPVDDASPVKEADQAHRFLRQMAAVYNPAAYTKDVVLEMHFTDLDSTYQLILGPEKCACKADNFAPYTTRIETPFDTWLQISEGKIGGPEAMMKHLYKVLGDFDLMMEMDKLFPSGEPQAPAEGQGLTKLRNSNMLLALLPFLALWIFLPMNAQAGAVAGILAAGLVPILHIWWKPTPYERIGALAGIMIGLYTLLSGGAAWRIGLPSFAFGAMWTASAFLKIPLTAYYSCKDYGGEAAFVNPLFMKTNRILTAMWGVTNLLLGMAALLVAGSAVAGYWGLLTNVPTLLLGLFTGWFAKWYPAHVARG